MLRLIFTGLVFLFLLVSCRKVCPRYSYNVAGKITVLPERTISVGDTLMYKIEIPYNAKILTTNDFVNIKNREFSELFISVSARERIIQGGVDSINLIPDCLGSGKIKVVNLITKNQIASFRNLPFTRTDSSYILKLGIIPNFTFGGIYVIKPFDIESRTSCDRVIINYEYTNTSQNFDLGNMPANFSFSPNDYVFKAL